MMREALVHWCVIGMVVAAGCTKNTKDPGAPTDAGTDAAIDGPPDIAFEGLVPIEWSLATDAGNRWQIALSDVAGAKACALSADQHNGLGAAGGEIIIQLPDTATGPCPAGDYTLQKCPNDLGTAAFVPAGCGFYRKFDASGGVLGTTASLTGGVKIAGTASMCTLRVNVGFLGMSFTNQATLLNADATQPWCVQD